MLSRITNSLSMTIIILLTISSFAVGILRRCVGLALGTIRLPIMLISGIDTRVASGTNILISSISSFGGSLNHIKEKRVNKHIVIFMGIPALFGALLGGLISTKIPTDLLLILAGIFVTWQGLEFILLVYKNTGNEISNAFGKYLEESKGILNKKNHYRIFIWPIDWYFRRSSWIDTWQYKTTSNNPHIKNRP